MRRQKQREQGRMRDGQGKKTLGSRVSRVPRLRGRKPIGGLGKEGRGWPRKCSFESQRPNNKMSIFALPLFNVWSKRILKGVPLVWRISVQHWLQTCNPYSRDLSFVILWQVYRQHLQQRWISPYQSPGHGRGRFRWWLGTCQCLVFGRRCFAL